MDRAIADACRTVSSTYSLLDRKGVFRDSRTKRALSRAWFARLDAAKRFSENLREQLTMSSRKGYNAFSWVLWFALILP
jgi:hypothetical protein